MTIDKKSCLISDVKIEDLSEIYQIEKVSYKFPWSMQSICDQINSKNAYNRSIYLNIDSSFNKSMLVGYIFGYIVLNELYITNICIHPHFLKMKLASILLENLFCYAKCFSIKSIFLEVRKSNFAALALYKKFHFIEDGERKQFYTDGESAVLMHIDI
jgi:[ribosomal protein S18]-alanine N-acetyltransferase